MTLEVHYKRTHTHTRTHLFMFVCLLDANKRGQCKYKGIATCISTQYLLAIFQKQLLVITINMLHATKQKKKSGNSSNSAHFFLRPL